LGQQAPSHNDDHDDSDINDDDAAIYHQTYNHHRAEAERDPHL